MGHEYSPFRISRFNHLYLNYISDGGAREGRKKRPVSFVLLLQIPLSCFPCCLLRISTSIAAKSSNEKRWALNSSNLSCRGCLLSAASTNRPFLQFCRSGTPSPACLWSHSNPWIRSSPGVMPHALGWNFVSGFLCTPHWCESRLSLFSQMGWLQSFWLITPHGIVSSSTCCRAVWYIS